VWSFLRQFLIALWLVGSGNAFAARPQVVDDARLFDAKACQLETWAQWNRNSTDFGFAPACNPGNLELGFAVVRTREQGETHTTQVQIQAKTVFKATEPNGWGIGLVVGNLDFPRAEPRRGTNLYGYVPVSVSFADDAFVLHANFGFARAEDENRHRAIYGLGAEVRLRERLYFKPEAFRLESGRPFWQAGLGYALVPERVAIEVSYGNRWGRASAERWVFLGLRFVTPPVLP